MTPSPSYKSSSAVSEMDASPYKDLRFAHVLQKRIVGRFPSPPNRGFRRDGGVPSRVGVEHW